MLAVNKMDLVEFSEASFQAISDEYRAFAGELGIEDVHAVPMSALTGDNVTKRSAEMPWYQGPSFDGTLGVHRD